MVSLVSLLNKAQQTITVFPEETYIDDDGNTILRPAVLGYVTKAEIQAARQSGTSARRAEQDNEGYETEEVYRLRFSRRHDRTHPMLTQGAQIEWNGEVWHVVGNPTIYMGSRRTSHIDYQIKRN
jgi:hypothetical protein